MNTKLRFTGSRTSSNNQKFSIGIGTSTTGDCFTEVQIPTSLQSEEVDLYTLIQNAGISDMTQDFYVGIRFWSNIQAQTSVTMSLSEFSVGV